MTKKNKIFLLGTIVIIVVLVFLGIPLFIKSDDKAKLSQIQTDVGVAEANLLSYMVEHNRVPEGAEVVDSKVLETAMHEGRLFTPDGKTTSFGGTSFFKVENMLKSRLSGDFIANEFGDVYYIHDKPVEDSYNKLPADMAVTADRPCQPGREETFLYTPADLYNIRNCLDGNYTLMADLDLSVYGTAEGWEPIGTKNNGFVGIFDGNGFKITNLKIDRSDSDYTGLFGYTHGAVLKNIVLEGMDVTGGKYTGGLVGWQSKGITEGCCLSGNVEGEKCAGGLVGGNDRGFLEGSCFNGTVMGNYHFKDEEQAEFNFEKDKDIMVEGKEFIISSDTGSAGGLVGHNFSGIIKNCYSSGNVEGKYNAGGLVGENNKGVMEGCSFDGDVVGAIYVGGLAGCSLGILSTTILNCHATGSVMGDGFIGGLVGSSFDIGTAIENCYSTGDTRKGVSAGGLVGFSFGSSSATIKNCYSTGNVRESMCAGGLVGYSLGIGNLISNCYSTGDVRGEVCVGGLVGWNEKSTIKNSYSAGKVEGERFAGGHVGNNRGGIVENCYWDMEASSQTKSDGGEGGTTSKMKQETFFKDWDFNHTWQMNEGTTYPRFKESSFTPE